MEDKEMVFSRRLVPSEHVLVRELDDEAVVLHLGEEAYYGLNKTGARLWRLLTTKATIQEAYDELLKDYRVPAPVLKKDLESFVRVLLEKKMVEVRE